VSGIGREDAVADEDMAAVLDRLMDQFGGGHGAPPASDDAVKALHTFVVDDVASLPLEIELHVNGLPGSVRSPYTTL
jgi:hypothetical protein